MKLRNRLILLDNFIVFKLLEIHREIRFGESRKNYEDRMASNLQEKINKMILKDEFRRVKRK